MDREKRLEFVVERLVEAVTSVVKEHEVREEELFSALRFLTEVGKADEFVLLSDVLGVSVAVNEVEHAGDPPGCTPSNVTGPFWAPAPALDNGGSLVHDDEPGERLLVSGQVRSTGGDPVAGATVDVWQANAAGLYDLQLPDLDGPRWRGALTTGPDGRYRFLTVTPPPYRIKHDGPVGGFLASLGRDGYRPAHIHYRVTATGFEPLVTMVFFSGDPWLGNDAVHADKPALVTAIERAGGEPAQARFDLVLAPIGAEPGTPQMRG